MYKNNLVNSECLIYNSEKEIEVICKNEQPDQGSTEKQKAERKLAMQWRLMWMCLSIVCIGCLLLASAAWMYSIYFSASCTTSTLESGVFSKTSGETSSVSETSFIEEKFSSSQEEVLADGNKTVLFVERNEWFAHSPTTPLEELRPPVPFVLLSHTGTRTCATFDECSMLIRFTQLFDIESRSWPDIGYNFVVGGDGRVYVGRGWNHIGAPRFGLNHTLVISVIGTFDREAPPKIQLDALRGLLEFGVQTGKISPDYLFFVKAQLTVTYSSGVALYNIITKWPHWSKSPSFL